MSFWPGVKSQNCPFTWHLRFSEKFRVQEKLQSLLHSAGCTFRPRRGFPWAFMYSLPTSRSLFLTFFPHKCSFRSLFLVRGRCSGACVEHWSLAVVVVSDKRVPTESESISSVLSPVSGENVGSSTESSSKSSKEVSLPLVSLEFSSAVDAFL